MELRVKTFEALSNKELYQLLKLRFDVFVIEQSSIYEDLDEIDYHTLHIFAKDKNRIVSYARIYRKDEITASIGRVVVEKRYRGKGLGKEIFSRSMEEVRKKYQPEKVIISSQERLIPFYSDYGYTVISEPYDDGGVMHVDMQYLLAE